MNATALAALPPQEEHPTYEQLCDSFKAASEEYLVCIRAKDHEGALHAESDMKELTSALERVRFGWVSNG